MPIQFKCWTCGTDMQASEDKSGLIQICPFCETPNQVPKPLDIKDVNTPDPCYFCGQSSSEPTSASVLSLRMSIKEPFYRCTKCGNRWQEPAKVEKIKAGGEKHNYQPKCPSCSSDRCIPMYLPPIPIGKYYRDFKSLGMYQNDFDLDLILVGLVTVPRCKKCKLIHSRIDIISTLVSVIMALVGGIMICIVFGIRDRLSVIILSVVLLFLSFFVIGLPLGRLLQRTIGKETVSEDRNRDFPVVRSLFQLGWK